jgi:hypothetical protein
VPLLIDNSCFALIFAALRCSSLLIYFVRLYFVALILTSVNWIAKAFVNVRIVWSFCGYNIVTTFADCCDFSRRIDHSVSNVIQWICCNFKLTWPESHFDQWAASQAVLDCQIYLIGQWTKRHFQSFMTIDEAGW